MNCIFLVQQFEELVVYFSDLTSSETRKLLKEKRGILKAHRDLEIIQTHLRAYHTACLGYSLNKERRVMLLLNFKT